MVRPALEVIGALAVVVLSAQPAAAFCGFFVGKADAKLFNKASQVVMVRDEDRTVLTMASDYEGSLKEFALVVPVPQVLQKGQIHIGDKKYVDRIDAFTAPRLVEYHDPDPCHVPLPAPPTSAMAMESGAAPTGGARSSAKSLGVTIEAQYTVGEYDILILSAKESNGLVTWLVQEGYKMPAGAGPIVSSYLKQGMKFFVAKVNLKEHDKLGGGALRPIQVAYESPKFMLPIRLGTVNAKGPQDMLVYTLTKTGRVETTNYRTVKLPSDMNVPEYVGAEFPAFYKAMFQHQVDKNDMRAVFTEYAWDMGWCDPCAADPLTAEEQRALGVFWTDQPAYVTRLHVRYDREHFPEDLVFQTTSDRANFQGRYVMQHPFKGPMECPAAEGYLRLVRERQELEAKNLVELTGWKLQDVRKKMKLDEAGPGGKKWYDKLWK